MEAMKGPAMSFDLGFFLRFVFHPYPSLLQGVGVTVITAILAMIWGVVLGTLLAIIGMSQSRVARWFNSAYVFAFRGTPLLVQLILIYFGLPYLIGLNLFPNQVTFLGFVIPGAIFAGLTGFGLNEAAYVSEIARAAISAVDPGQMEAAKSLSMTPALAMRRIVLPQAFRVMIPPLGNQFNGLLKATSMLSLIAVPEMFFVASAINDATFKTFEVYLGVSVYYLALTGLWALLQRWLETRFSRGVARL
jgi:polar amino acid transport system permease protein